MYNICIVVEIYKRDVYKTQKLRQEISILYFENRCVYGARRIHEILKLRGFKVSYKTICVACKNLGFVSVSSLTTDLDIKKPIKKYEEIGHNEDKAKKPKVPSTINEVWLCDWTCFYVGKREEYVKVYVYCIMDLYSRRIISFGVSENGEDTSIQIEVLKNAIVERNPLNNIVIHSDNGESFKDEFYRKIINTNLNLMQTFNRVEFACADNSHMESFFATLNKEFYRPSFLKVKPTDSLYKYITPRLTIYNFERLLRKYINFYNNKRVHSGIGYLTPRQFESSVKSYVPIPYRRTILHVDINACFAQYEIMMNPSLKDKNLVVIGEEYKRDQIIVCASYNARKYGIGCGDRLKYAKHKCPDLVVRKSKKKVYEKISSKFFEILYRYTDRVEPYGIDEGWLDVTYSKRLFGSGLNIANLIMNDLKNEMGLTVSVGISYNKIFSKLASDLHKPDAITQIPYKYYREIVHKLPVEMLLFVGDKTKVLFNNKGIKTIGDLAFASIDIVKEVIGEKNALKLIHFANGYEFTPVKLYGEKETPKSISRAETTYNDLRTYGDLRVLIERLSEDVAKRLRQEKLKAGAVCLKLRDRAYNEKSMQKQLLSFIDNGIMLSDEICELFLLKTYGYENEIVNRVVNKTNALSLENLVSLADIISLDKMPLSRPIREISVSAFKLVGNDEPQIETFIDDKTKVEKLKKLDAAMDKVNNKYNSNLVKMGYLAEPWWNRYIEMAKEDIEYRKNKYLLS